MATPCRLAPVARHELLTEANVKSRSVSPDSSASVLPMATTSSSGGSFLSSDSSGLSGLQNTSSPLRLPTDAMTVLQQEDMSDTMHAS